MIPHRFFDVGLLQAFTKSGNTLLIGANKSDYKGGRRHVAWDNQGRFHGKEGFELGSKQMGM